MISWFKDISGKVTVNSSAWILDNEDLEILKDITVSKGEEIVQRIQVRCVLDNSLVDAGMDEGLRPSWETCVSIRGRCHQGTTVFCRW